jgi:hypothetical protein
MTGARRYWLAILAGLTAIGLLVAGLSGGVAPVAGQTISSAPPALPAPDCPAFIPGAEAGPSPQPSPVPDTTPSPDPSPRPGTAPSPEPAQDQAQVEAVPPRRARTPAVLAQWRGEWDTPWDHVAIAPRTDAIVVTDPGRPFGTVLWGGAGADGRLLNDGVMIDDSGATRVLPAAPICPRRDFGWSLDGSRNLLIWGGVDQAGTPLSDGAWYSLDYGTWGLLPDAPLPAGPAAMAGSYIVAADPETGTALLSAARDLDEVPRWEAPIEVPLPAGVRYEVLCCEVGGGAWLTVFSIGADGFAIAARMDTEYPGVGEWTQFGRVPLPSTNGGGPVSAWATERDLTAWVRTTDQPFPGTDLSGAYGLLMRTGRPDQPWRLTAPAPEPVLGDRSLVLSPAHLISVQGMVAYDLMRERWLRLPKRGGSSRFGPPVGATAWWNDGRLWVFGGRAPDGSMESRLWTFTPDLPRDTVRPPTRPDLGGYLEGCVAVGASGTWRLRGAPDDPLIVWTQSGTSRQDTHWPEGWVARFRPELEILDTRGRVRARDGDICRLDPGTGG